MEWLIWPWLVRWTLTVSPRWTRIVGPGTVPPKVHAWTTKPSATVMSFSMIGMSMSWTVPSRSFGAFGSNSVWAGALGSATGAEAAPPAVGAAARAAGISMAVATLTWPFMPASAWPGI